MQQEQQTGRDWEGIPAEEGKPIDLVLEGGGVKGIGLVGALSVLEEEGYRFQNIAGTSAGAIVAALIAVGYRAEELREVIMELNFETFTDEDAVDRIPFVGKRTVDIPTLGVSTTQFDLSHEQKKALYQAGREAARKFLEDFDYEDHLRVRREEGRL